MYIVKEVKMKSRANFGRIVKVAAHLIVGFGIFGPLEVSSRSGTQIRPDIRDAR